MGRITCVKGELLKALHERPVKRLRLRHRLRSQSMMRLLLCRIAKDMKAA